MKTLSYSFLTAVLCSMAACGGGGGGSSSFSGITLTGVAATGAAISSGTVEAKCKTGTGTATSNADGSFEVKVSNGVGPCMLKAVDPITKTTVYSFVEQGSTTANINPVTHLVVANVLGDDPATSFTQFTDTVASNITTDKINAGMTNIRAATAAIGTDADMKDVDFLKGSMKAATSGQAGDSTDQKIDALMASLIASDKKISDLATQIKSVKSETEAKSKMETVVGKAKNALESCPYVRSGKIWALNIYGGDPVGYDMDFTAGSMKMTNLSTNVSSDVVLKKDTSGKTIPCAFTSTIDGNALEVRVSEGGVWAWAMSSSNQFGITVPQQTNNSLTDANFAGTYPAIAFLNNTSYGQFADPRKYVINTSSSMKAYGCDTTSSTAAPDCTEEIETITSDSCTKNADGTYSCTHPDGGSYKTILYSTGSQSTMFITVTDTYVSQFKTTFNGLIAMTKLTPMSLPSVGQERAAGMEWSVGSYYTQNSSLGFYSGENSGSKVMTVSPQTNSYTYVIAPQDSQPTTYTRYINPQSGFALTTKTNFKSLSIGSPTGWALGVGQYVPGFGGNFKDFNINIRAKR